MKIVMVSGSKRKGNSEFIANKIQEDLLQNDMIELTTIKLSEVNIEFCNGCLYCDETHHCNLDDDMTRYVDDIANADGLIFISPVRWSLMSGEMKVFLDRLNPLAVPMLLSGKKCVTIVVGQSEEEEGDSVKAASYAFKLFADNAEIELCEQVEIFSCLAIDDIKEKSIAIEKSISACRNLIDMLGR